jgi:hypothetical protein
MVTLIAMIKAIIVKIRFIFVVFRFENKPDEWGIQRIIKKDHQEIQRSGLGYFRGGDEYGN